ncbi:S8 family serine peptidase [Actinoplanes sp. DH11]|uniref:S8 family serine peptidase n=1 Tax=Actinoplanes sp. DH11 TaxID=2857011 RepID=UPI001E336624|nr:S8 family serine peptidase [Actinoplanes sp. DH11]
MRIVSSSLIAALLATGFSVPATAATADPVGLDVGLADGADASAVISALGPDVPFRKLAGLNAVTVDVPADKVASALATLGQTAGVRYAERGALVQADTARSNTGFNDAEIPQAWTWTTGSRDVTVAVVDTGVSVTKDLQPDRFTAGYDFIGGDDDATDESGHGTLVAGVIAGDIDDDDSSASGVCDTCRIMPVRVLHDRGTSATQGTSANVASGIVWAADNGAQIINLSLSTPTDSTMLREAVAYAAGKGSLIVASAGNATGTARRYPAAYEPALAVAWRGNPRNSPSDRWVDIAGPTGMVMLGRDGVRRQVGGSSAATASLSGIAALALAFKPSATAAEIREAIRHNGELVSAQAPHDPPMVNAARTIYSLGATDTVAPVLTSTGFTNNQLVGGKGQYSAAVVTDDHGVDRVETIVGGKVVDIATRLQWQTSVVPKPGTEGPLTVTVRAYDYAGNVSELSTVIRADTKAPRATMTQPAANAVAHKTVDVAISTPDTDVAYLYSPVNGASAFTWDAKAKLWRGRVPVQAERDGYSQIDIAIVDRADNHTWASRKVRVDTAPPAGGTISPASGTKVRGTFTSTLTGVTDLGGVAKAELWANGKYVGADKTAPYALPVKTGTYSGAVKLTWKVTDRFGLARTLPIRTVTADNKAPSVSITKAPKNKAKVKGTVRVYAKASDTSGIARVELIINGKVVAKDTTAGYVLSVNTKKQKKTMKVQVRAYDKLGHVKYTSSRTWHRK